MPRSLRKLRAAVMVLLVAAAPAAAQAPKVDYRGNGVIVAIMPPPSSLHATRPVIVLEHDPLPPLMPEHMIMPFIAASTELFRGFAVGDRVAFGLQDTPGALLVVTLERARR
ncbi:MAG: copper-binding protein [Candidatus Rokubacteria bacterium]|nr:copper-binding protein [Candidatus Rokubacteria bacterium]